MRKLTFLCYTMVCGLLGLVFAASALAQTNPESHGLTFNVGAGFTAITGYDAGKLDHGGNVQAGAGFNFSQYFGVTGNYMFNWLGMTGAELTTLNEPNGFAHVSSFTVDPTVHLPLGHGVNAYLLAGGGYLRRTVEFTQPTLAQTFVFAPWWGYVGPALVPVNQVLGSISSNAGAYDVGGLNFPLPRTKLHMYIESRYIHGFTSASNTTVVPISVGIRW